MGIKDLAISYVVFSTIHLFLFALALTTIGLYGTDLHNANKQGKYSDSKWVYAVVVGSISAVTCVLYFIPFVLRVAGFVVAVWDFILFVLWIALFGVFGKVRSIIRQVLTANDRRHRLADICETCRCTSMRTPRVTVVSSA
ncbi:hypothetical protein FVEG_02560 [Fusarium verticillioides 7600]|uniref:MARVEL domain-containing protein n=1 Tax=Gibberella moniliformis (strain M3125 / FGSC 7600) TaxID=334819 RepID=W7LWU4_GIBM7|nr:hypothetical protein FVEG_02560 [Fusarium verticillioides 7600]EWG39945.1 hypothetical protein FVEG_02560 [Fusarium verticillioides 7600]